MGENKITINRKNIIIISVIVVVIIAVTVVLANIGKFKSPTSSEQEILESTDVESEITETTKAKAVGFPVAFTSNDIIDIEVIGSRVFVLTQKLLTCVSSAGKTEYEVILNFANPVIKAGTKYGIVYDRTSGKYKIFSKSGIIYDGQVKDGNGILTADINNSGSYAIASRGDGVASILSFFDKNGELKYKWACTKESIICISVAENNRYLACAALTSKKGNELTKIYCFDINSEETRNEYSVSSCAPCDLYFDGSDTIILSANDRRIVFDTDKENGNPNKVNYSGDPLIISSDENGMTAVVTEMLGSFNTRLLTLYNKKNDIVYTFETEKKIIDVVSEGKKTYILTPDSIFKLSARGSDATLIELDDTEKGLAVSDSNIYHFAIGYLYKD